MSEQPQYGECPGTAPEEAATLPPMYGERPDEAELAAEHERLTVAQQQALQQLETAEQEAAEAERELTTLVDAGSDYREVARTCDVLEGLIERGGVEVFWGGDVSEAEARTHLEQARSRCSVFLKQVEELEARHQEALRGLADKQAHIEALEFELHEVEQAQESWRQEWVIERDENRLPTRRIAMPWMRGFEDDLRFRNLLTGSMAAALLLGLLIPLIDIPLPERDEIIEVPERFARFIREERQPPLAVREPPPAPDEAPREPDPEPEEVAERPEETRIAEVETPAQPEPSAKERVASKGILAFRDNFSSLKSSRPAARLGAEASLSNDGAAELGLPQRNMVAAQGSDSSGGINLAAISRDVGGGGVALSEGVELARVASAIDGGGPSDRPRSSGASAGRTDEEIQIVFDRYKAALYRLYNRALRADPTLKGQIVLQLTIEPNGSVSVCSVQRSDMGAPELASQVAASVSGFQFGAKDVPPVTILYPIDFLPTA